MISIHSFGRGEGTALVQASMARPGRSAAASRRRGCPYSDRISEDRAESTPDIYGNARALHRDSRRGIHGTVRTTKNELGGTSRGRTGDLCPAKPGRTRVDPDKKPSPPLADRF